MQSRSCELMIHHEDTLLIKQKLVNCTWNLIAQVLATFITELFARAIQLTVRVDSWKKNENQKKKKKRKNMRKRGWKMKKKREKNTSAGDKPHDFHSVGGWFSYLLFLCHEIAFISALFILRACNFYASLMQPATTLSLPPPSNSKPCFQLWQRKPSCFYIDTRRIDKSSVKLSIHRSPAGPH